MFLVNCALEFSYNRTASTYEVYRYATKQTIKKSFPLIGRLRYVLETIRPEIMQYFVETNKEGRPINRQCRSLIYQRSKKTNDTVPFGTQVDVYSASYEWMDHSMYAKGEKEINDKSLIDVGGPDCKQSYFASLLNISAMSFGSLSMNALLKYDEIFPYTETGSLLN